MFASVVGPPPADSYEKHLFADLRQCYDAGDMEDIEIQYEPKPMPPKNPKGGIVLNRGGRPNDFVAQLVAPRIKTSKSQTYKVKDARQMEIDAQIQKLLQAEVIVKRAIRETEEYGIVFIDELDKIAGTAARYHADASDEGVQRDLLPLIEGTKITTDHGDVDTSKILFITAGAFHQAKPSDLLAELQGRLPIRVQLHDLNEDDLYRILTEPEAHQVKQARALLLTEGVDLRFTDEGIREIAKVASEVNKSVENIGARRLYTVVEKILEEVSFNASQYKGQLVIIDREDVQRHLKEFKDKTDLKHFIL